MAGDEADDAAQEKKKDGKELFRELLQVYPRAAYEDYMKLGQWEVEVIEIDLELIRAHRKEAGAPEPIPLEEVKLPALPPSTAEKLVALKAQQAAAKAKAGTVVPAKAGATTKLDPQAELRLIALFIAKWKLDPTKTKLTLARLPPPRRKWVMANYKGTPTLDQYLANCEKTNLWASAGTSTAGTMAPKIGAPSVRPVAAKPGAIPKPGALRPVSAVRPAIPKPAAPRPGVTAAVGMKRPLTVVTPQSVAEAAKRPRLGVATAGAASAGKGIARPVAATMTSSWSGPRAVTARPAAASSSSWSARPPTPTAAASSWKGGGTASWTSQGPAGGSWGSGGGGGKGGAAWSAAGATQRIAKPPAPRPGAGAVIGSRAGAGYSAASYSQPAKAGGWGGPPKAKAKVGTGGLIRNLLNSIG